LIASSATLDLKAAVYRFFGIGTLHFTLYTMVQFIGSNIHHYFFVYFIALLSKEIFEF